MLSYSLSKKPSGCLLVTDVDILSKTVRCKILIKSNESHFSINVKAIITLGLSSRLIALIISLWTKKGAKFQTKRESLRRVIRYRR